MRNNMALGWFYSHSQIRHYVTSRVNFPPASKDQDAEPHHHLEAARFSPLAYVLGWVRWVVSSNVFYENLPWLAT